jgi:hypothetical protein
MAAVRTVEDEAASLTTLRRGYRTRTVHSDAKPRPSVGVMARLSAAYRFVDDLLGNDRKLVMLMLAQHA